MKYKCSLKLFKLSDLTDDFKYKNQLVGAYEERGTGILEEGHWIEREDLRFSHLSCETLDKSFLHLGKFSS